MGKPDHLLVQKHRFNQSLQPLIPRSNKGDMRDLPYYIKIGSRYNFSKNIQMYLSELVRWKEKNKIKLVKKKFNLNKINFYILKLQIKYILFKIFNIKL